MLWADEHVVAFHMPPLAETGNPRPYLGHLNIVTRRHVPYLADLSNDEAAAAGVAAAGLARALRDAAGAEWVFSAVIGTGTPHFHQHLLPRYPGTPKEVPWHSVDKWRGGPHGGADEVEDFCRRLMASPTISAQ